MCLHFSVGIGNILKYNGLRFLQNGEWVMNRVASGEPVQTRSQSRWLIIIIRSPFQTVFIDSQRGGYNLLVEY
jgi:hypothetical protein